MTQVDLLPTPPGSIMPKSNKFPKGSIGPQFVNKFMPWFERFWHEHKRYPSITDIITQFGFTAEQVNLLNQSKFWLQSLDRRGIARPDSQLNKLSDKQVAAVAIMSNFSDRRPVLARLAEIEVTQEELNGWMSNPTFKNYFHMRAQDVFENVSPVATVALARQIEKENFAAIKFYFEITGQAQSPEAINVKQAMNVLIEAVQKHVQDPAVLQAIAEEVQAVRGIQGV